MDHGVQGIEDHCPHDQSEQVIDQINKGCSFTILICSDCRDQNRTGRTDTDTKYDRERACKSQDSGHGQRLQYTNGRRSTLQHCGK